MTLAESKDPAFVLCYDKRGAAWLFRNIFCRLAPTERRLGWCWLHLAAGFECATQGDLVGVLKIAADGQTAGDTRHFDA